MSGFTVAELAASLRRSEDAVRSFVLEAEEQGLLEKAGDRWVWTAPADLTAALTILNEGDE